MPPRVYCTSLSPRGLRGRATSSSLFIAFTSMPLSDVTGLVSGVVASTVCRVRLSVFYYPYLGFRQNFRFLSLGPRILDLSFFSALGGGGNASALSIYDVLLAGVLLFLSWVLNFN